MLIRISFKKKTIKIFLKKIYYEKNKKPLNIKWINWRRLFQIYLKFKCQYIIILNICKENFT